MRPAIYVDLRCLQDRDFQRRGIGYHTAALLRGRKRSALSEWRTVGLIDQRMPDLPSDFIPLIDEISPSVNPCFNGSFAIFLDGSPMTHDPRFGLRFQNHPRFLRAAVLYDFIPLDWPGYLPTVASRIEYLAKLARLKKFDLFFPISEYTASRLSKLLGVSRARIHVTGASVRRSLYESRGRLPSPASPYDVAVPYFVSLGGDDRRKNTEAALKAVKRLNLLYSRRIPLKVIGFYCDAYKFDLLRLAGHEQGQGFLELYPNIGDEEVVSLHAGAIAAIAPSHIEGFSLPVAEASVCGCPIIASTCAAHMELIQGREALFQSDDSVALSEKLEAVLFDPALRASLMASQAHLASKFHEDAVADRFWSVIANGVEHRRNVHAVAVSRKPHLAFLSPCSQDLSDASSYTAMMIRAGAKRFDADLYTDAARPLPFDASFVDAGGITVAPFAGRYSAVVCLLGNSTSYARVYEIFERYGGPCILNDARLTQFYFHYLGDEEFLKFSSKLLGRPASMDEVSMWVQDRYPPSLFLEPIIKRASPLIVHTAPQQELIKKRYGVDAHVTTCCPSVFLDDDELTTGSIEAVRKRLAIPDDAFVVSTFGHVDRNNGMDTCILATELLRSWNIPVELYFIGDASGAEPEIGRIATMYGIAAHVHCGVDFAREGSYRDFLIASDAAVQLRTYAFGQLSTNLVNCIGAGLAGVATSDLANSSDAPSYVRTVPDRFSPLQVAEQLALIWEAKPERISNSNERATYLERHNFDYYAKRLTQILGIA